MYSSILALFSISGIFIDYDPVWFLGTAAGLYMMISSILAERSQDHLEEIKRSSEKMEEFMKIQVELTRSLNHRMSDLDDLLRKIAKFKDSEE